MQTAWCKANLTATLLRPRHGTAVPYEFYKLLVWCNRKNEVAAEYFFVKHEDKTNVSTISDFIIIQLYTNTNCKLSHNKSGVQQKMEIPSMISSSLFSSGLEYCTGLIH